MDDLPLDPETLAKTITVANARALLETVCCPVCECYGALELFTEPNNGGTGIICGACNTRHPLSGIMWIPRGEKKQRPKRLVDRAAVIEERGSYCWVCGSDLQTLRNVGIGWDAHHTRPYAIYGDAYPIIPLCKVCHEITNALQRYMSKLLSLIRQPKEPNND
jgi:hypothetical protein